MTSSGKSLKTDQDGAKVVGESLAHTALLFLLLGRPEELAGPDELSSPWADPLEVTSGQKTKAQYVKEGFEVIDMVPPNILELVVQDLVASNRSIKPSKRELQRLCLAALKMQRDVNNLDS